MFTIRRGAVALVSVALVAGGGVAAAQHDAPPQPVPLAEPGTTQPPVSDAPPSVKQRLGVFRRGRTGVRADIAGEFIAATGINLRQARRLRGTERVYAVPGQGTVCVLDAHESVTCTPNAAIGRDFGVQATCEQGLAVSVSGLVPDGLDAATIRQQGGNGLDVAVTSNYIDASVPVSSQADVPTAVELGGQSYPVPVLTLADMECAGQ